MPKHIIQMPFLANNIRNFRKLRGLKIYELAEKIGMTEAHFGRIERGINTPSASVVMEIADILKIPVGNLFDNPEKESNNIIHFRGEKELSKSFLKNIDKIIQSYSELEDFCQAGKYRSFPLDIPLKDFKDDDIEKASELTRELLGIRNAIVYDLFDLFESYGLRIIVMELPLDMSGFSYCSLKSNNITFFINSKITLERKIYTLAHELGHVIFHQGGLKHTAGILNYPENSIREINYEHAANYFSACFLMPANIIKSVIKQMGISKDEWSFDILIRIKKRFGVSSEAFLKRLFELNLIEEKLFIKIKKDILEYYKQNKNTEPNPLNIEISLNNRIWDLLLIAKSKKGSGKTFEIMENEFKEQKII